MNKQCKLCGSTENIEKHHVFFGEASPGKSFKHSQLSNKYGMCIDLCFDCHHDVHNDSQTDLMLKMVYQRHFEAEHSREEFINTFGESYL